MRCQVFLSDNYFYDQLFSCSGTFIAFQKNSPCAPDLNAVEFKMTITAHYQQLTSIVSRSKVRFMNVNLGPVFDEFVAKMLKTGLYQSQSEILREGLRLLKEREDLKKMRLAEIRREIAVGVEQADRGEFVDGPKAFTEIRRKSKRKKTGRR
jgi:antitoxin ParD1/3/4